MSPAPPCSAIAQPIDISLDLTWHWPSSQATGAVANILATPQGRRHICCVSRGATTNQSCTSARRNKQTTQSHGSLRKDWWVLHQLQRWTADWQLLVLRLSAMAGWIGRAPADPLALRRINVPAACRFCGGLGRMGSTTRCQQMWRCTVAHGLWVTF
jgi:hypothetical protein